MNEEIRKNKIKSFISDSVMSDSVYQVILNSFLAERQNQDVHVLAASRLSIDFLKQGWKDLERFKNVEVNKGKSVDNIGL